MAWEHEKSGVTIALDVVRNVATALATIWTTYTIARYSWLWAAIAFLPVGVLMLNVCGFLTLPLYRLTPENRLKARVHRAMMRGDVAEGDLLTKEFEKRFNVNVPAGGSTAPENRLASDSEYQSALAERDAARRAYTDLLKEKGSRGPKVD